MTVQELIALLRECPPHALVTRGDADWYSVEVTTVSEDYVTDANCDPRGSRKFWEYCSPDDEPVTHTVRIR